MKLALMRYKGFTFWCNPLSIEVLSQQNTVDYTLPYSGEKLESLGKKCRIIKGKGEIKGKDCLEQYAKLYALQSQGGKGILSLPEIKPMEAFFTSLSVLADVTPDKICYSFTFVEADSKAAKAFVKTHKVSKGETLFDIAYAYGVKVENLVDLNPFVRRTDELEAGWEIRIC